jgi:2-polyprenyl-3-methyl-5-hydroxy-6-metoxy-1,4-benzoquinol methylase
VVRCETTFYASVSESAALMASPDSIQTLRSSVGQQFRGSYLEWKNWDGGDFGRYSRLDSQYFAVEFDISRPIELRALEIGFGNGAALGWLHELGADTYGVEANPILVDRAADLLGASRVFDDLQAVALSELAGTFDRIIALDVIEHVPLDELGPMLSRICELLAPGGAAVFRFPNGDSPFGRVNQHGDPTHVTTLGSARLTYLAERAGLDVEVIRAPALPIRGVGFARGVKRSIIRGTRMLIEYAVSQIYFGGRRIPLDPNYTAVLRRSSGRRAPQLKSHLQGDHL